MLRYYYKIWVSLFAKIYKVQNENYDASILLSLIILTTTNTINFFLLAYLSITMFNVDLVNTNYGKLIIPLIFLTLNYLLLIRNNKHKKLLEKYRNVNINLGFYYFIFSCIAILLFVFMAIISPELFGLKKI